MITGSLLFIWKKIFSTIQLSETKKRRQEKLKRFSSSSVFGLLYPLGSNVLVYNDAECLFTRLLTSRKLFVSKSCLEVWKGPRQQFSYLPILGIYCRLSLGRRIQFTPKMCNSISGLLRGLRCVPNLNPGFVLSAPYHCAVFYGQGLYWASLHSLVFR